MAAPTIVFDLDGTLIDTAPDLIDTLNVVFAREGLPPVPYETARNLIGGGARMMIARGIEAEGRAIAPAKLERLFADFIAHYTDHIADRSRPFPGLTDALDVLAADGCRFAVCTNKLERLSVLLLKQLKLADRFAAICGQDTFGIQKPDPEVLRRTIAAAGGNLPTRDHDRRFRHRYPHRARGRHSGHCRRFRLQRAPGVRIWAGPHHQPFCAIAGRHRRDFACKLMRASARIWLMR